MLIKKVHSKRARADVWLFDFQYRGKRYRQGGFKTRALCESAALALKGKLQRQRYGLEPAEQSAVTLKELIDRRLEHTGDTRKRHWRAHYFRLFAAMLPAGVRVVDITPHDLSRYVEGRVKSVKVQSAFRELTEIVAMLNRARDYFPTLEEWTPPRRPRLRVPSGQRERVITPEEAARLFAALRRPREDGETERMAHLRAEAADLLQIALQSAARRSEILSLRWSDVNFAWNTLRIVGTKTDRVRVIPLSDSLRELFARRREAVQGDLVFPRAADASLTNSIYAAASKLAGIPYGRETPGGWVLHDARHTAITAMLHGGASIESVMSVSGHQAKTMVLRYSHSTERTRRAAVAALDQFADDNLSADGTQPTQETRTTQQRRTKNPA